MDKSDLVLEATRERMKLDIETLFETDTEYVELPLKPQEKSFFSVCG